MPSSNAPEDRPPNKHYEKDIHRALQFCNWVLKLLGIYPIFYNRKNKLERATSTLLILICCSILQFVIVPFGYYVLFYEKDMYMKIQFLGPLAFCVTSQCKYGYLGVKGSAFGRCIEQVKNDWKILQDDDHRNIMIQHVTMCRNLIKVYAIFLYTGSLSYHTIMPFLSKRDENDTQRPLTYPGYEAFFDVQKSPAYEIVYCMHCLYVLVTNNIMMVGYSMTAIFTTHVCGQIKIQTLRLDNLTKKRNELEKYSVQNRLAIVVRDHVKILR